MMTNTRMTAYTLQEGAPAHKAWYWLSRLHEYKIVLVTDDVGKLVGILTIEDFNNADTGIGKDYALRGPIRLGHTAYDNATCGDICNRNFKFIRDDEDRYEAGRRIFADAGLKIQCLPVVDKNGVAVDLFGRWQAFYREYLQTHRHYRMWYAEAIMNAAELAKRKGYTEISVLEFGVAGGSGLYRAELYAIETERLTGVRIHLYGFDLGTGLPMPNAADSSIWVQGDYQMDEQKLRTQLQRAQLVLGDIRDTTVTFFEKYQPAPIGAVLIDTDLYEATVAVLDMLSGSDDNFLPIVWMWFDDLLANTEYNGEWLALREYNAKSINSKIVPEGLTCGRTDAIGVMLHDDLWWSRHFKRNIRYTHPKLKRDCNEPNPCELLL